MTKSAIREFIIESFMFGAPSAELSDDASLLESQIIDSTGVIELVVFLEQEFGIAVEDSDLVPENLDSVDRICGYLQGKGVTARAS
ncbi:MAG: acyl carrier protein [Planctomycetota bacterium]|jgi:acyl carrier protein